MLTDCRFARKAPPAPAFHFIRDGHGFAVQSDDDDIVFRCVRLDEAIGFAREAIRREGGAYVVSGELGSVGPELFPILCNEN